MKLPRADADAPITWWGVVGGIVASTAGSWIVGYAFQWTLDWAAPELKGLPDPLEMAGFMAIIMGVMMTLLFVTMRFHPGRTKMRELEREEILRKIRNYQTKYPESGDFKL